MSTKAEELAKALLSAPGAWQVARYCDDAAIELRRLAEIERQYLALKAELTECKAAYESQFKELAALKASIGEPVAWGLFAQVEAGVFHLQHPVRFTENDAKADRTMYDRTTQIRIHPLYAIKENQP